MAINDGSFVSHQLRLTQRRQSKLIPDCLVMDIVDTQHSPHCRACKERVRELLTAIYGVCRANHQFTWPSHPEDYANTPIGNLLQQIRTALGDFRGHRDFIKSPQVPPCDYYVTDPPFILEFDESQHFSQPRSIALSFYPSEMSMGFFGFALAATLPRYRRR